MHLGLRLLGPGAVFVTYKTRKNNLIYKGGLLSINNIKSLLATYFYLLESETRQNSLTIIRSQVS